MSSMCAGKKVFRSELIANTRADQINRKKLPGQRTMRSYQCPTCANWHLSSQWRTVVRERA